MHTQVQASIGPETPGGFTYELTRQLVALAILAGANQVISRFASILRGPSHSEHQARAIIPVIAVAALMYAGTSWLDRLPPVAGIAVPILYALAVALTLIGMVGLLLARAPSGV